MFVRLEDVPLRIYVAAKYSAPTDVERLANTGPPILAARELLALGFCPFVPQLSHHIDPTAELFTWSQWMDWCLNWLISCDAMLMLSDSKGVQVEREFAQLNGIPVFETVEQIVAWRREKECD